MAKIINYRTRDFKNPSSLTPYEEKIWELHKAGHPPKEIGQMIGTKHASTIISRLSLIREKLETQNV